MAEPRLPLVIVGAGGHAREIHDIAVAIDAAAPSWDVRGFAVEGRFLPAAPVHGLPVFDIAELATRHADAHVVVAIGAPEVRARVAATIDAMGPRRYATLVHPRASVGPRVVLGEGCVVFPGCVLTSDITLGRHVHVNTAATVSHDCRLADFATLSPRACCCGGVVLGEGVDIGAGAVMIPRVTIGDRAVVGAGATVLRDVPPASVAVGVPARALVKKRPPPP
jgi:sugar O-acyltransferase (sialic acid O-acetyltransferase NeuD family)